jgi:RND family efflux transporter MFP subunit
MSNALSDSHDVGEISTAQTTKEAIHEHGPETQETIAFLKEQQWTLDFATAVVEDRELKSSLRVPAEVIPRSGGEAEVSAPLDGRVAGGRLPVIGTRVRAGETLLSIVPPTMLPGDLASLQLALEEAEAEFNYARKDRERAERLVSAGAAPGKRLEEARTAEAKSAARVKAARARIGQYNATSAGTGTPENSKLFAVRAPISGVITETHTAPGANVRAGETLYKVVDVDTVYISAIVPEAELPRMRQLTGAEMEIPGTQKPRALKRLISVGRVVETTSRTFPVIYELDNRDRAVAVNQAIHVRLLTNKSALSPAVPESAVVDDAGRPIVFVQLTGEAFVRRPVKLGVSEGGMVEVLEGVMPGERVVVTGAHLVRLASMSSQAPAHGHVH